MEDKPEGLCVEDWLFACRIVRQFRTGRNIEVGGAAFEICMSDTWHWERCETKFPSMDVAIPVLRIAEADNLRTREEIKRQRNQ